MLKMNGHNNYVDNIIMFKYTLIFITNPKLLSLPSKPGTALDTIEVCDGTGRRNQKGT